MDCTNAPHCVQMRAHSIKWKHIWLKAIRILSAVCVCVMCAHIYASHTAPAYLARHTQRALLPVTFRWTSARQPGEASRTRTINLGIWVRFQFYTIFHSSGGSSARFERTHLHYTLLTSYIARARSLVWYIIRNHRRACRVWWRIYTVYMVSCRPRAM